MAKVKTYPPSVSTGKSDYVPIVPAQELRDQRQLAWDELQLVKRKDPAKAVELRHTIHRLSEEIRNSERRYTR